jgi:tetratricopeptide (TPR) repeat protein
MRTLTWLTAVLLATVACGKKKTEDQAPDLVSSAKKASDPKKQKVLESLQGVTVPSKSPDAIAAFENGMSVPEDPGGGTNEDAKKAFKQAIELDPDFALAYTYLDTGGAAGAEYRAKASRLAANLPEAERELIVGNLALNAGDRIKAIGSFEKVLRIAPRAWGVELMLGALANNGTTDGATLAIRRARRR